MRLYATSVCGLKLIIVYAALSYWCRHLSQGTYGEEAGYAGSNEAASYGSNVRGIECGVDIAKCCGKHAILRHHQNDPRIRIHACQHNARQTDKHRNINKRN